MYLSQVCTSAHIHKSFKLIKRFYLLFCTSIASSKISEIVIESCAAFISCLLFQGHCLSTINPVAHGYTGEDIGNVPTYPIDAEHYQIPEDKLISTEGCFSCKVCKL
jgi:hypothetical protein